MTTAHPPAAERRRPTLGDGLVAVLVLAAAIGIFWGLRPAPSNLLTAVVVLDSETIATFDLNTLIGPIQLPVTNCPYPLTVEAEPGRIRIAESSCPGADCVRTGWADRPGAQIICLPNKLIISISGGGNTQIPIIDGVTH